MFLVARNGPDIIVTESECEELARKYNAIYYDNLQPNFLINELR